MSDEDLEVLITLDYPWYAPDEDIFNHQSVRFTKGDYDVQRSRDE